MSRIISLSVDNEFANSLDSLIEKSGYKNRSRFLRDAALFFAEMQQRGDLLNMDEDLTVEGHLVVYYQEGVCLLYTSPSPRDGLLSRMPSSA